MRKLLLFLIVVLALPSTATKSRWLNFVRWLLPNGCPPSMRFAQGVRDLERMLALGVDGLQIDSVYDTYLFDVLKKDR